MLTDPILNEKWRIQKKLAKKANYDIDKLIDDIHSNFVMIKKETKIRFKYSNKKGGYIENSSYPLMVSDKVKK